MGDLVTSSSAALSFAKKNSSLSSEMNFDELISAGAIIPDPVFFCAIEAPSHGQQAALDKALNELQKEDPSLRVIVNTETGQTVLGGMGELHLDVIKGRIRKEYKVKANLGPVQIAYRETIIEKVRETFYLKHQMGKTH